MSRIRGKNTKPELVVRRMLHSMGFRFRLHRRDLPGKPDIVLPRHGVCIFVQACGAEKSQVAGPTALRVCEIL